jgi:hypothetical protein
MTAHFLISNIFKKSSMKLEQQNHNNAGASSNHLFQSVCDYVQVGETVMYWHDGAPVLGRQRVIRQSACAYSG